MKHTLAFLTKLMNLLSHVPLYLDSDTDVRKATRVVQLIEEYDQIIRRLIHSHKSEKYLKRLKQAHADKVSDWGEHVEDILSRLDKILTILDEDVEKLQSIIKRRSAGDIGRDEWRNTVAFMSQGLYISQLYDEEEKDIARLHRLAIFETHELEEIIKDEKHIKGLHNWLSFGHKTSAERAKIEIEFFDKLLS